ncbi:Mif2/CENP-C cupin domain-containing protein [Rozella allomycis CSF55]|uniref:CENP-C homolog n=1 Tax=Rozella allomycis (strain CSF55) TaxID=988480 RepID=A0A075B2Q7_ROZAC|nr:Mif2/CENP-C cupin domain-containing protein [Rozella allomycis CSF55]|eukprot:EPZ36852.1 Mif2/CENP-C cupin domain-containing protein [Rozella allomycis CSF55]
MGDLKDQTKEREQPIVEQLGKRKRIRPLEYWRNERVVYENRTIKDVIVKPIEIDKPQPKKSNPSLRLKGYKEQRDSIELPILDFESKKEKEKIIACTRDSKGARKIAGVGLKIKNNFDEKSMVSGLMVFDPKSEKSNSNSGAFSMVFYVVSGIFEVSIHKNTFILSVGGQFHVPRGNQYKIRNVTQREAKLFFCNCKFD